MSDRLEAASVFARLIALGTTYQLDLTALFDRLATLADPLSRFAMITVDGRFDRLAVATRLDARTAVAEIDRLRLAHDEAHAARFAQLASTNTNEVYVELQTVPGRPRDLAITLEAFGQRDIVADLAVVGGFGVPSAVRASVRATLDLLGGAIAGIADRVAPDGSRTWSVRIVHANAAADDRTATRHHLDRAAAERGATAAQRTLVASVHDVLAKGQPSFAAVAFSPVALAAQLRVGWTEVAWPSVVRIAQNLGHHPETGTRLGELAGAVDEERASLVELELGAAEPPPISIAATLLSGR